MKFQLRERTFLAMFLHWNNEIDKKDSFVNNILDDDDEPVVGRRGMKPPISKRNDDGRSVASRRNDETNTIISRNESRWGTKDEVKTSVNIVEPSEGSFGKHNEGSFGTIQSPKKQAFPK